MTKTVGKVRPKGTGTLRRGGIASIAQAVRSRIENSRGDSYCCLEDFDRLSSPAAVARSLQRLEKEGVINRVYSGIYYKPRDAFFGETVPSHNEIRARSTRNHAVHPSGLTASALLGLSTQVTARLELATSAEKAPQSLRRSKVHAGRPKIRSLLNREDGALLELLRARARYSDLPAEQTIDALIRYLETQSKLPKLVLAAMDEPPRVRAMLGALLEQSSAPKKFSDKLRSSLANPLSRFDFGLLRALPNASDWQAK